MTKREMYESIINGNITNEVVEMAQSEIEKLDKRNESRKGENSKKAQENAPIKENIVALLTGKEGMVASEIAAELRLSTSKVTALAGQMVEAGILTKEKVKSGKSKVFRYTVV